MNGNWQIFISDTTPTSLGNGVRFHYNPKTNKLQYRDPETAAWVDVPFIDFSPYLTKLSAAATYLSQTDASIIYLSQVDADTVYLTKTEAAETYIDKSSIEDPGDAFLTENNAALIYLSKSDAQNIYATLNSPIFTGNVVLPANTSIGTVSATEIQHLDGSTENLQDQIDRKTQYTIIEATEDVEADKDYQILADTTGGSLTVTFPESPDIGDIIYVIDTTMMAFKEPIFIDGNGLPVHGKEELFGINVAGATMVFMYVGGTMGWKVV
jgi:hypothetical protein